MQNDPQFGSRLRRFVIRAIPWALVAAAIGAACSSSPASSRGPGNGETGGAGGGNLGNGGLIQGSGGSILGNGDGSVGGTGGSPLPMVPCDANGKCDAASICVANVCAPNKGPCMTDKQCSGDSYCCAAGCRTDGVSDGVCIPYGYGPRGTVNSECKGGTAKLGVFSPAVQCEWKPTDASTRVLTMPLVADLPNDSGAAAEIVVITYDGDDGSSDEPGKSGEIRIINGQTCQLLETINAVPVHGASTPALADLDNDGKIDIVARRLVQGVVAFHWDDGAKKFVKWWEAADGEAMTGLKAQAWDGPSIHDLDDDGYPEVLLRAYVYNGRTGATMSNMATSSPFNGWIPVAADLDGDHTVELISPTASNGLSWYSWMGGKWVDRWDITLPQITIGSHFAVADFGTPGATGAEFNWDAPDGTAEIIVVGDDVGTVKMYTMKGQLIMEVHTTGSQHWGNDRGGPPTVGDFDNDGKPEFAVAGATYLRVFDPDCRPGGPKAAGCADPWVLWKQKSQDDTSAQTASTIFDFDGDKKAEVVYADECFLRVYSGDTGKVLYSAYRTSATWYEAPLVADVDRDDSTEIVVNSNQSVLCPTQQEGGAANKPYVDPIHPGVACDNDAGCLPGSPCMDGYCRCTANEQCGEGLSCAAPLTGGGGNVCRATHPNSDNQGGIRVLRERLDRWASSRSIWNQHAYSITNVNDDGKIPKTSAWEQNWKHPGYNNYRANVQGTTGFEDFADITGKLNQDDACVSSGGNVTMTAQVCNRGKKSVGAAMPATFYLGDPAEKKILCVSYTKEPVRTGADACKPVSCDVPAAQAGLASQQNITITMVVNDDGKGGRTTEECNSDNNKDAIMLKSCVIN
jgi:hypothetical protein